MQIDKLTAMSNLVPDSNYEIIGDTVIAHRGRIPSDAEIETEMNRMQAEYDAQAYARARQSSYPSIGDQLDMQYHDSVRGTTTWKDAVAKVKADNPKPE